jgi:hypothetical protein
LKSSPLSADQSSHLPEPRELFEHVDVIDVERIDQHAQRSAAVAAVRRIIREQ